MNPLTEEQIEQLLKQLPHYERNSKAEAVFYRKLQASSEGLGEGKKMRFFAWPRFAFATGLVAVLLLTVGTVFAYQPSVTRDNFLYPLKQTAEKIELASAFSEMDKIDAHLRFSDRRLEEAQNIILENPSLSFFVPAALAHEGEVHLSSESAINFADTLADMHMEVSLASEIVETQIVEPYEADQALTRIENATDRHIIVLKKFSDHPAVEVRTIVEDVSGDEDASLAAMVEAHETVKHALAKKDTSVKVQLKMKLRAERKAKREDQATEELNQTQKAFDQLTDDQKKEFSKKIDMAKEALANGKFGRTEGLSRALLRQMKKELHGTSTSLGTSTKMRKEIDKSGDSKHGNNRQERGASREDKTLEP